MATAADEEGGEEKGGEAGNGEPGEEFLGEEVGFGLKLDLLGGVDGGKGVGDGAVVIGPEIASAGGGGDVAQGAFVEVAGDLAVAEDAAGGAVHDGYGHEAVAAGADGVSRDVAGAGYVGGGAGLEGATVVGAIGEEDDEGALAAVAVEAVGLFEAGEGDAEAVTDGGAVFDEADAEAGDLFAQPRVVESERGEGVGAAGEDDDTDAVGGAVVDEGLDDGRDGLEAVDALAAALEILCEHRAGEVDREDDIVALGADLAAVFDALGTGEGDYD